MSRLDPETEKLARLLYAPLRRMGYRDWDKMKPNQKLKYLVIAAEVRKQYENPGLHAEPMV